MVTILFTCPHFEGVGCAFRGWAALSRVIDIPSIMPGSTYLGLYIQDEQVQYASLDIAGVDACQRSFCIAFAFLGGDETDYIWALDRLRSTYEACGVKLPSVILTDRCLACMNAVSHCFPTAVSLLCLWYANKAVLRYCLPSFSQDTDTAQVQQEWKEFYGSGMKLWHLQPRRHLKRNFSSLKSVMFQLMLEKLAISSRLSLNSTRRSL
jgi:hypothetical protein